MDGGTSSGRQNLNALMRAKMFDFDTRHVVAVMSSARPSGNRFSTNRLTAPAA